MKIRLHHVICSVVFAVVLLAGSQGSFAQARLVINNGSAVYMRMSGGTSGTPIYLVLDNANANAITCGGAGAVCPASGSLGWIISEGQYNYVKWRQVAATTCVVPFGTIAATGSYLPLTFAKTTAGAADLSLSTWPSAADGTPGDNQPWAGISDAGTVAAVSNMYSSTLGQDCADESVIDRWWDMYTGGVATTANVTFSYRGSENTMSASPTGALSAQHWTGTVWNDGKGGGPGTKTSTGSNGGTTAATVYTATATGLNQFTPYVLVSDAAPLPVTWLDFSAECNRGEVMIKWSTASEQNSDYFTVERSADGINYDPIANVTAAGQSSTVRKYWAIDTDPLSGTSFYRVRETDFNGSFMHTGQIIVNGCSNDDIFIYGVGGGVSVNIDAIEDARYTLELYDALGQKLVGEVKEVTAGSNHLKMNVSNIASAMYVVKVYSSSNAVTKKVFIRAAY